MIGDKTCWGKGYGTEVMSLLLRHCFGTLNLNRVQLRVFSRNARARRTYEKVGFIEEGTLRQAGYNQGKYDDTIIMGILRSEWLSKEE
jgi:RimJ/RimL family protein N-acetyltransferase